MASNILKNTLTNYLVVFVRLLQGILVTRWTIQYLGNEVYGLWALLWSFFAYSLLFNFGFGAAAQKYTSTEIFKKDIKRYNSIVSTIFTFQVGISLLLILGSIIASFYLSTIFRISDPAKLPYFRFCFLLFAFGTAILFPTGLFSELLVGLHKFYIRNYINSISKVCELIGVLLIFLLDGGLAALIILPFVFWLISNTLMGYLIKRYIPGFKLSFHFDWKTCKDVAHFSGFVYVISVANLILSKTTHLLISLFYGLAPVGIFNQAGRLSELSSLMVTQYQENVRPIVASLHAKDEYDEMRNFMTHSMRWNCFFGLIIMVPTFIFAKEAFIILINVSAPEVIYLSRLSLIATFLWLATRQIPHSFLLMTDRHKLLAGIIISEALLNLGINLATLPRFGISSVLWNSMLIASPLTFGIMFPVLVHTLKLRIFSWLWTVYVLPFLLCVPGAWLAVLFKQRWGNVLGNFGTAVLGGLICSGILAVLGFFFLLKREEREKLINSIRTKLSVFHRKSA